MNADAFGRVESVMHEFYVDIMEKLAIPMKQIRPYTLRHLEVVLIAVLLALAFAFLFAKTNVNRSGVITVFGVVLVILEVFKQCLLTYVTGHYSWSDFPWQLCSVPMYLCIAHSFAKRSRGTIENYLMCFGFLGGVAAMIEPRSSFYPYLLLTIHSVAWHAILLMLSFYLMMGTSKSRSVRGYRSAGILYVITALIAILINWLTVGVSEGASNMFFLGPNYPHMFILNAIYHSYGWIVESIVMILATLAAGFVVYFVSGMGKRK